MRLQTERPRRVIDGTALGPRRLQRSNKREVEWRSKERMSNSSDARSPASDELADLQPAGTGPSPYATLLYVEDNLSNIRLVERLCDRRPGLQLLIASNGAAVRERLAEHHLDLILLDLNQPDNS